MEKQLTKRKRCPKVNALSYAHMMKFLMEGTRTMFELAEETGLHIGTIRDYCRELHRMGVIHVIMWEPDSNGKYSQRVYKLGKGRDAIAPKGDNKERCRAYRRKQNTLAVTRAIAGVA